MPFADTAAPPLRGARVVGLGAARPANTVAGRDLVGAFGKTAEWLRARTGIERLHRLTAPEDLAGLALAAARNALADSGHCAADVDLIVVATCSQPAGPGTTPLAERVREGLGAQATALDANAACAGFCYVLGLAADLIATGSARVALVIGAEQMSALVDPSDLGTSILFGDGAGAVVVTACDRDEHGIGPTAWMSDGNQVDALFVPPGCTALKMDGPRVFRWAVEEVPKIIDQALTRAGLRPDQIDVFVPHQANLRIVDAVRTRAGLTHAVTATDVVTSGNTSAASIPMALMRLREQGRLRCGQLAMLVGFGAGVTISAQVVRLP